MSTRIRFRSIELVMAVMVIWAALQGCGDDETAEMQPSGAGIGGTSAGGTGATASEPEGGGSGGQTNPSYTPPHECEPEDHDDDPCLACLTTVCCDELKHAGAFDQMGYSGYDPKFLCTQACFESNAGGDSGTETSLERLLDCAPECHPVEFDYRQRDLLACATGGTRPVPIVELGQVTWREGEPDEDAGIAANCLAECLPSWE